MRKYLWIAAMGLVACGSDKKAPGPIGGTVATPTGDNITGNPTTDASSFTGPTTAFMGRFADVANGGGKQMGWAGSRITARVSGTTQVAIGLRKSNPFNPTSVFFNVTVDGGEPTRFALDNKNPAAALSYAVTLPDTNPHVVQWTKITEAAYGEVIFTAVTPGPGGTLLPTPTPAARHIEFIGDSIVNGYGVVGSMLLGSTSCSGNANTANADKSFATLTARALSADYTLIAYSGRGLETNLDGSASYSQEANSPANANNVVPAMFLNTLPPVSGARVNPVLWDSSQLAPDVVVINLGTNDFSYALNQQQTCTLITCNPDETDFVAAYVAFLQKVRSTYPKALIVAAVGPMYSDVPPPTGGSQHTTAAKYAANAVAQFADSNAAMYDFGVQDTSQPTGCDAHPSAAEHQQMATGGGGTQGLANFIKDKKGWN